MSYTIKDENNVPKLLEVLDELERSRIEIGIFEENDEHYEGEEGNKQATVLLVATVNEFGCRIQVTDKMRRYLHAMGLHLSEHTELIDIPERSFLRSGFDDHKDDIEETAQKLLDDVLALKTPVKVFFDTLGEYVVGKLQEYLTDLNDPANHPFTIAQKGSSNPLIDTGRLRQAITFRVVKK